MIPRRAFVFSGLAASLSALWARLAGATSTGVKPINGIAPPQDGNFQIEPPEVPKTGLRKVFRLRKDMGAMPIEWEEQQEDDVIIVMDVSAAGVITGLGTHRALAAPEPSLPYRVRCAPLSLDDVAALLPAEC